MEIERIHRLVDEKKWTLILREFDQRISNLEESSDNSEYAELVWIFENLDLDFREEHAQKYYSVMWKIAFKAGKIKLAKSYAEFILDYFIEYKRIPALRKLHEELLNEGLLKNNKNFKMIDAILGKKSFPLEDSRWFEAHPEMWKNSKNILKQYLLDETSWKSEEWKLAYEYILKFHYDKDLFLALAEKAQSLKKSEHKRKFLAFLASKKVDIKAFEEKKPQAVSSKKDTVLNVDYDQLAMDVMSGVMEPSLAEQKRILISIHDLSNEDLVTKGKDMVVAFGLLGMDKVVASLCERILPLLTEVSQRASIQFMMAQALYNNNEFYKVIDMIDDTFNEEPLLDEEVLAFNYLKAESFLKLKKNRAAKELFLIIKKYNPHYRLVGERLRHLEEIK